MAIDFPDSPTVDQQYSVGDRTWTWNGTYWQLSQTSSTFTASDTAPVSPSAGDIWFESDTGQTFVYYDQSWVEIGAATDLSDILSDADADTSIQVEASSDEDVIRFRTAGTERISVDASGNVAVDTDTLYVDSTNNRVGIGTTTPQTPLGVNGSIDIVGTSRSIVFGRQSEGGPHGLEVWDSGSLESALYYRTTPNTWSFENSSGTDTLTVDIPNSSVGINDDTPSYTLDVNGDINTTGNLRFQGTVGYTYVQTLYFTSSGTFTKASYPWLKAVRVKCQGAGGGGGGTDQCGVGEAAAASGGGGGCYAESFITDISALAASVTVLVGFGGAGGTGGDSGNPTAANASDGGDSSFGSGAAYEVSASGGFAGGAGRDSTAAYGQTGEPARRAGTGDILISASATEHSYSVGTTDASVTMANGSSGGSSVLGGGGRGGRERNDNNSSAGSNGLLYGGGGGGGATTAQSVLTDGANGGTGAAGIVIVELFA